MLPPCAPTHTYRCAPMGAHATTGPSYPTLHPLVCQSQSPCLCVTHSHAPLPATHTWWRTHLCVAPSHPACGPSQTHGWYSRSAAERQHARASGLRPLAQLAPPPRPLQPRLGGYLGPPLPHPPTPPPLRRHLALMWQPVESGHARVVRTREALGCCAACSAMHGHSGGPPGAQSDGPQWMGERGEAVVGHMVPRRVKRLEEGKGPQGNTGP